ncbi:hypothetical protein [Pricia sp.]
MKTKKRVLGISAPLQYLFFCNGTDFNGIVALGTGQVHNSIKW